MDETTLKRVYKTIRKSISGWEFFEKNREKSNKDLEEHGGLPLNLTRKYLLDDSGLDLETVEDAIKNLYGRGLIKITGENQKPITNIETGCKDSSMAAYQINFLRFAEPDKEFKIKKSGKGNGINIGANNWNEVEIRFLDKSTIEVLVAGKPTHRCSCTDLGFYVGTKQRKPDEAWNFLESLSVLQGPNGMDATKQIMCDSLSKPGKKITKNNCEQIVKRVSNGLNERLGMKGNPLNSYKGLGCYKPIFKLKPIPQMRKWHEEPFITPHKDINDKFGYGKNKDDGFTASEDDETMPLPEDED